MSLHTTRPPRRANSTANAAPMPLPAPVTTAAARRLVFGRSEHRYPVSSIPACVRSAVAQRTRNERRDVSHRLCCLGRQPRQRLEHMRLVRPHLQFAGAAGGADVRGEPVGVRRQESPHRRPGSASAAGPARPTTSRASRGCAGSIPRQYNWTRRAASAALIAGSRRSRSRARAEREGDIDQRREQHERGRPRRQRTAVQHQVDGKVAACGIAGDDDSSGGKPGRRQQPIPAGVHVIGGGGEAVLEARVGSRRRTPAASVNRDSHAARRRCVRGEHNA